MKLEVNSFSFLLSLPLPFPFDPSPCDLSLRYKPAFVPDNITRHRILKECGSLLWQGQNAKSWSAIVQINGILRNHIEFIRR